MLTLLKQARAFGLGIVLATQNPVDLDYKGLSNIGTWFLGRLQTERDKARVLEGLEGAAGQAGQKFDRGKMERVLAGLGNRVFLMNNVHDGFPTVFQTRWAMSFLAGPLARGQISQLMAGRKAAAESELSAAAQPQPSAGEPEQAERPVVPAGIEERFLACNLRPADAAKLVYRPAIYGEGSMHFVRAAANLDSWRDARRIVPCYHGFPSQLWQSSEPLPEDVDFIDDPEAEFRFASLPDELLKKGKYRSYRAQLKDYLYRHCNATIYSTPLVKGYAPAGDKSDAIAYFTHRIHEERDVAIEQLRDKYEAKLDSLEKKIQKAQDRVEREKMQSRTSLITAGSSILGAVLGGFLGGRRTGVSTIARGVGNASQQGSDVYRAERALGLLEEDQDELRESLEQDLAALKKSTTPTNWSWKKRKSPREKAT